MTEGEKDDLEQISCGRGRESVWRELFELLRDNKKWWLTPIILVLMVVGLLIVLSTTALAPFIYTLF